MSSSDSADSTDDAAARQDDAAARQAAEVAVELSEAGGPPDTRRLARGLRAVADRASTAVTAATATAKRGTTTAARRSAEGARKGAAGAGRGARSGAGSAGKGLSIGMSWLTGQAVAMGPRLRVRDQATLRKQFPGQTDDAIAELLIDRAARAAAAVGGTTGAWAALPVLPAFPAEIAAETLAIVGIEVKLVAELHEIFGMAATGSPAERARAYLGAWASRRGVYRVEGGLLLVAGSPLARQLTRRLAARVRRSAFSLGPFFTGAVAGALINRRETRKLGILIRDELRGNHRMVSATVLD
jgi:uncharacterized protein (DUF697 family)